jgi:chemotaxis protein MotB
MIDRSPHVRRTFASSGGALRAGRDRWLISYADLMTLLFACFTTAYAAAQVSAAPQPVVSTPVPAPEIVRIEQDLASAAAGLRAVIEPIVIAALGDRDVELVEDRRGLVVSLPESATFSTGSAALTDNAQVFLAALATALRPTDMVLRIEGHTDDVPLSGGRFGTNWELSTARASAVVLFLIRDASFAPERLSAAGYGEFHPRVPNDTPEHRARNRRVDVVVAETDQGVRQ